MRRLRTGEFRFGSAELAKKSKTEKPGSPPVKYNIYTLPNKHSYAALNVRKPKTPYPPRMFPCKVSPSLGDKNVK